jgi:predicted DCC family thiol-disulfide oxidoreductase YuxK
MLVNMISRPLDIQFQQAAIVEKWQESFEHPLWKIDSIKVLKDHQIYVKSEAISILLKEAKWYFQPFRIIFILPRTLLDRGYDWIAKNRSLWGNTCAL